MGYATTMSNTAITQALKHLLRRPADSYKYQFGHILILGGSPGLTGAPLLSALAALRSGAGLVTVASPIAEQLTGRYPEIMTLTLASGPKRATETAVTYMAAHHVNVLVAGPGMTAQQAALLRAVIAQANIPVVVDAGGLGAFTNKLPALKAITELNPDLILTPHAGEYQKLSGQTVTTGPNRIAQARNFTSQHNLTLLLKGSRSIMADASRAYLENNTGNPGLATAGSGDVLSGIIAALVAQGLPSLQAAAGGAYLHGLAADLAVRDKTEPGMIASDIIDYLPAAFKSL